MNARETFNAPTTLKELNTVESKFTGSTLGLFGTNLLMLLGTIVTFGIAFPWLVCFQKRYVTEHTYINGKQQCFDGKGIQLIGKSILWTFFTIITFGIFGFWFAYNVHKWTVQHTHFVGEECNESKFDGNAVAYIGNNILAVLLTVITLGFAMTWGQCRKQRFLDNHSIISGYRLNFNGNGGQLFGKMLLWNFLTVITLGIYGLFRAVAYKKWLIKHSEVAYAEKTMVLPAKELEEYNNIVIKTTPEESIILSSKPTEERKHIKITITSGIYRDESFVPSRVLRNVIGTTMSFGSEEKMISCLKAALEILQDSIEKEFVASLLKISRSNIKKTIKELNKLMNA